MIVPTELMPLIAGILALLIGLTIAFGHRCADKSAKQDEKTKIDELNEIRVAMRSKKTIPVLDKIWRLFVEPAQKRRDQNRKFEIDVLLYDTQHACMHALNETAKPFFIDPMTFAFARDLSNVSKDGRIRKSYSMLAQDYGSPFSDCVSGHPLIPSQFRNDTLQLDDSLISGICKTILDFQRSIMPATTDFSKYNRILKKGIPPHPVSPSFLVAPYFYVKRYGGEWYATSLRFAERARDLKGESELYPVICISRDILWDETQISRIVTDYEGFDGYLIWIDGADEKSLSEHELTGFKTLVSKLAAFGKPIYSLYGGYLCDLLGKFGLSGYCSGICYGESRSVDTKGGGAGNRYYIPTAHLKISEDLANAFFSASDGNSNLLCSCPICSEIREGLPSSLDRREFIARFFTQMDFFDFRRHFVNVKFQEEMILENMSNDEVLDALNNDARILFEIDSFPGQPSELSRHHLLSWRTLFEGN